MKLADSVLIQATHLAEGSEQFPDTTTEEWIRSLVVLNERGHMETVVSPQGVLCGLMIWARATEPLEETPEQLPEDLDSGDYIQVMLAVVHPMLKDAGEGLIRDMRDKVLEKNRDAKHWSWCRSKAGDERLVTHPIKGRNHGK